MEGFALCIGVAVYGDIGKCQVAGLLVAQRQLILVGGFIPAYAVAAYGEAHIEPPFAHKAVGVFILLLEGTGQQTLFCPVHTLSLIHI